MEYLTADVLRDPFLQAVQQCATVVKKTDPIQAYQCIRLEAGDGEILNIAGLSREITITNSISARITARGSAVAIPAARLVDVLDAMPENEMVRIEATATTVKLVSPHHSTRLSTLDASFLVLPDLGQQTILGTITDGAEAIFRGSYAADNEGLLSAMRLDIQQGKLIVSATNRYRGVTMPTDLGETHDDQIFALPKDTAGLITKLFKGQATMIAATDRFITFNTGTLSMICLTLAATPPNFAASMPSDYSCELTMPTKTFRKEVRAARALSDENSRGKVIIKPAENMIHLSASNASYGEASIEAIGQHGSGDDTTIYVNLNYLDDALAQVSGEACVLKISTNVTSNIMAITPQFGTGETHLIGGMAA